MPRAPLSSRRPALRRIALTSCVALGVALGMTVLSAEAAPSLSTTKLGEPTLSPTTLTKTTLPKTTAPKSAGPKIMICRGPFLVDSGAAADIRARKSTRLPGNFGQDLDPGRCAFTDRLLTGSERAEVSFSYSGNSNGANLGLGVLSTMSVCALDEDCIFSASVEPKGAGYFKTVINMSPKIWKRGRHPATNF